MQVSVKGAVQIAAEEGIVPGPYLDSQGVWTFGIGHTAAAGAPIPAKMTRGMPVDLDAALHEALRLFVLDLRHYAADVLEAVQVPLKQHELDALTGFHYNTGGILHASITRHLNQGNRVMAARAFDMWHRPPSLTARRNRQRELFATGTYSGRATSVWKVDRSGHVTFKAVGTFNAKEMEAMVTRVMAQETI